MFTNENITPLVNKHLDLSLTMDTSWRIKMKAEIHVFLDREMRSTFLTKCKQQDTNGSRQIRLWIRKFLDGELT